MLSVVPGRASAIFNLEYPQSVVVVDDYATAQKIVDQLSDKEFPVENLCIVGTDLKTVERVTGRRTWGSVLGQGAVSGLGMGLLVGLMMMFFTPGGAVLSAADRTHRWCGYRHDYRRYYVLDEWWREGL